MNAIETIALSKRYGKVQALDQLSLQVPEGALFGLIGPNGAGKTTTFALLSGFLHPTSGEVRIRGQRLDPRRPPVGQVLALPQDAALPNSQRVLGALIYLAELGGMPRAEAKRKSEAALGRVGLSELADRRVVALSHGQRRRVGIAQTLVGNDEVIILDEPTAGLDPRTALELGELVKSLHQDRTILMSSHNLAELEALCSHAAILDKGRLVASGTMDEIRGTSLIMFVTLIRPASNIEALVKAVSVLPGVSRVTPAPDLAGVAVEYANASEADALTNQVVKVVMEQGEVLKGVERGKSLSQRFMETTGR